jgi:hypothetical protein
VFEVSTAGARLEAPPLSSGGARVRIDATARLSPGTRHSLQVLDDGEAIGAYLDGRLLFDGWQESPHGEVAGQDVGVALANGVETRVTRFEAHPRSVRIAALDAAPRPWTAAGSEDVVVDEFAGPAGDLSAPPTSSGAPTWQRLCGDGVIERTGDGTARVRASLESPNPSRTIYAVEWSDPTFADVAVTLVPPGAARGQGHWATSGLAFWQDPDNYLVVNQYLGDRDVGVSISAFLRANGEEVMRDHDAVWTNVGSRISHGVPGRLGVVFDGSQFVASIDAEPVLSRAMSDYRPSVSGLDINAVGLVVNWEWGADTGTRFERFVARH